MELSQINLRLLYVRTFRYDRNIHCKIAMSKVIRANARSDIITMKERDVQTAILKQIWVTVTGIKRKRTNRIMYEQRTLDIFLSHYNNGNKNPNNECLQTIYKKTGVTKKRIYQWFVNRRTRDST